MKLNSDNALFGLFVIAVAFCVGGLVLSAQAELPLCYMPDAEGACNTECLTVPDRPSQPEKCKEQYRRAKRCPPGNGIQSETACGKIWNTNSPYPDCAHATLVQCGWLAFTNGVCEG